MQVQTQSSLNFEAIRDKFRPTEWRVEAINTETGDVFVAVFRGPLARERAAEYAKFENETGSR
ncbi:MAG: hypothetical protein WCA38_12625 [Candidatus Acidiferrales bacterium]